MRDWIMKKLMTAAGVAVFSLTFAAFGFAAQGQTDTGGASGQVSPSTPGAANPDMGKWLATGYRQRRDKESQKEGEVIK